MAKRKGKNVCVVVLGDIGRSPRMQYHCVSLAREGYNVDIVGYNESEPIHELKSNKNIKIRKLATCPEFRKCKYNCAVFRFLVSSHN